MQSASGQQRHCYAGAVIGRAGQRPNGRLRLCEGRVNAHRLMVGIAIGPSSDEASCRLFLSPLAWESASQTEDAFSSL